MSNYFRTEFHAFFSICLQFTLLQTHSIVPLQPAMPYPRTFADVRLSLILCMKLTTETAYLIEFKGQIGAETLEVAPNDLQVIVS